MLSNEILSAAGVPPKTALLFGPIYDRKFEEFGVTQPIEKAHYFAQVLHESAMLRLMRETWANTKDQAGYERDFKKPWDKKQKAHRLGNFKLGDGRRYLGRGDIQTTGRFNYQRLTNKTGIDFVNNPEWLEQPEYAVLSGLSYWKDHGLSRIALGDDLGSTAKNGKNYNTALYYITKKINPGMRGLAKRQALFDKVFAIMQQRGYL